MVKDTMEPRIVALDLDKETAFATIIQKTQTQFHQERFRIDGIGRTRLRSSLRGGDLLYMEACPGSAFLADYLRPVVAKVELVNPAAFGRLLEFFQCKTDRNDSGLMARLAKVEELPTIWQPDAATRDAREAAEHRRTLDQERTRVRNRIHSQFVEHGLGYKADELLKMDSQALLVAVNTHFSPVARRRLASNLRLLSVIEDELLQADASIVAECAAGNIPRKELHDVIVTMPGMGDILAYMAAAAIGDPQRFTTKGSLPNYAGLTPALHSSGPGRPKHGRITRRGSAMLRHALVEAADNARRTPGRFKNLYLRIHRKTGSHGKAVVACAREMLEILWHLLRKKEKYIELTPEALQRKQKRRQKALQKASVVLQDAPDTRTTLLLNMDAIRATVHRLAAA